MGYLKAPFKPIFTSKTGIDLKFIAELHTMQINQRTLFILLSFLATQFILAQNINSSNERMRIPGLIDSSQKYLIHNPDRSADYLSKLLEISIRQSDVDGQVNAYKLLGSIQYNAGNYKQALDYYQKVLNEIKKGYEEKKTFDIYKLIGLANKALGNTEVSVLNFNLYKQKAKQYNDLSAMVDADNNLALFYIDNKQYDEAIQISKKNADAFNSRANNSKATPIQQNAAASNLILGKAYYMKGEKKNAVTELNNSVAVENQSIVYNDKDAKGVFKQSDSLVSQFSFQQSLGQSSRPDFTNALTNAANTNIGTNYLNENRTTDAIKYLENSGSYKTLALAYEKNGQYEKAINAYKRYIQSLDEEINTRLTDNRMSDQLNSTLDIMNKKVELLEKEKTISTKTIDLLKMEQNLQADKVSSRNYIIGLLAILAFVMIIVIYFVARTVNEKRTANLKLEMKSLRSQMNPHFVFNALNSVNGYISQNNERAANQFLSDFSMLMREVLNNAESDFITLAEEVNLLKHYLKLEHDRFNDKFDYTVTIDPQLEMDQLKVPSMLVQPFIENAIWHGLRYLEEKGNLELNIGLSNSNLLISILDNGIGRKNSKEIKTKNQKNYRSIAIQNIFKRIEIIKQVYKMPIEITLSDANPLDPAGNTGTLVKIICPINDLHT